MKTLNNLEQTVIAVSKYSTINQILKAKDLGFFVFGESKLQDLKVKYEAVNGVSWHFIGRLQTNKIAQIVKYSNVIHSVASIKSLEKINSSAFNIGKVQDIFIQVNISQETTKDGFNIEQVSNLDLSIYPNINVLGLMVIGPHTDDLALIEACFLTANELNSKLGFNYLSMGMSNDYELALKHGATHVRIGSLIFDQI